MRAICLVVILSLVQNEIFGYGGGSRRKTTVRRPFNSFRPDQECQYYYNGQYLPCSVSQGRPKYPPIQYPEEGTREGTRGRPRDEIREETRKEPTKSLTEGFELPCKTTDRIVGICRPPAFCFYQYDNLAEYKKNTCDYKPGLRGICCPVKEIRPALLKELPITIPTPIVTEGTVEVPYVAPEDIEEAVHEAKKIVQQLLKKEAFLIKNGTFQKKHTMERNYQGFFGIPDEGERLLARHGLIFAEASSFMKKKLGLGIRQARDGLPRYSLIGVKVPNGKEEQEDLCQLPRTNCDPNDKYRSADGSCNNLKNPLWGRSETPMIRLLPPRYSDGINELRKDVFNEELPNPRLISTKAAIDKQMPQRRFNLAVMQWGQFMDHDLTLALSTTLDNEEAEGILCCPGHVVFDPSIEIPSHPACRPFWVPKDDPFHRMRSQCLNFVRNTPAPRANCNLGPRDQLNRLTAFIDGSQIYGSNEDRAKDLRLFKDGLLRFSTVGGIEFLPQDTAGNFSDFCAIPEDIQRRDKQRCFFGGDVRVNEQTGLAVIHNLFLRWHNFMARQMKEVNPHWDDERLYQETRRVVISSIQHVTLNEWLMLLIGRKTMQEFNLSLRPYGYADDYDEDLNPSIINSFATAAYRLHTLIQGILNLRNSNEKVFSSLVLRNLFNNPTTLYRPGNYDGYLRSLTNDPTQDFDQFFTSEITNHLFEVHGAGFGLDLIAINIQRGRDHGLPGYNFYRKVCGQQKARNFEDLRYYLRPGSAEVMKKLYKHVDDIDLFVGLNHEIPIRDGVMGPTMACINAEQMRRGKQGDRFWYENGNTNANPLTPEQLTEIRKISLAAILCDGGSEVRRVPPLAFIQLNDDYNPLTSCKLIPRIDLGAWKESSGAYSGNNYGSNNYRHPEKKQRYSSSGGKVYFKKQKIYYQG